MSCYDWESGTIIIPSKIWSKFRSRLIAVWNAKQEAQYKKCLQTHEKLTEGLKGTRGKARQEKIDSIIKCAYRQPRGPYESSEYQTHEECEIEEMLRENLFKDDKIVKPQKKNFDIRAITKSTSMECDDGYVRFDNDTHSIHWHVSENNRACARAHSHWFAKALFTALYEVKWTRGSGGVISGNDEYSRDDEGYGGGGNQANFTYGPEGEREVSGSRR